jgi:2-dehydro-3-deoxygluconokinase
VIDPVAPTGLMLKERLGPAARRVWYYRRDSAGSRLCPDDVDPALLARARVVHVTGITPGLSPTAAAAVTRAVDLASDARALVSLDLNYRAAIWDARRFSAALRPLVERADLVFGSADELEMAMRGHPPSGEARSPERLARDVAAAGPGTVVVKRGADGALAWVEGEVISGAAVPVEVVDPVGAGDAFVAGWLVAQLRGEPAGERLRLGLAAGALACTAVGDWEGAPTSAGLATQLATHGAAEPVLR